MNEYESQIDIEKTERELIPNLEKLDFRKLIRRKTYQIRKSYINLIGYRILIQLEINPIGTNTTLINISIITSYVVICSASSI